MTVRVSIREFTLGNPLYRGATVAFHKVVDGVKSTQLATLYKSSTGTETLPNPQKLDSDGRLKQAVYVEEPVIAAVSGIAVPSHDTGIIGKQLGLSDVSDYIETLLDDADAATARATLGIPGVLADYYHRSGSSAITGSLNQPILTTGGTSTAYTLSPSAALSAYTAGVRYYVRFHVACGANPTLQISGLASPPNLVKRNPDGTMSNLSAGDVPADWRSWVTLVSATQALVEDLPRVNAYNATFQGTITQAPLTTSGTSTAYTLTPTDALAAYAAGVSYYVQFHTACGANPTLQISGLANPPNLVKRVGGTLVNLAADDIPTNWRSRVTLVSATQALVETMPFEDLAQRVIFSGDITPPTITADQNDYNPTGLSAASVVRLSSDAVRSITGIAGGTDGRILCLPNVGSNTIILPSQSTLSAAANRFAFEGDVSLAPGLAAIIIYDATSSRWRLLSAPSPRSLLLGPHTLSGSGTSITVTGIPAWANLVVVSFRNMSWNGTTGDLRLRLGTSGGIETANYVGGMGTINSSGGISVNTATNGITLGTGWEAASEFNGHIVLSRMSATQWSAVGNAHAVHSGLPYILMISSTSVLNGQLDRVQMLNTGTATFDNGTLSVLCLG